MAPSITDYTCRCRGCALSLRQGELLQTRIKRGFNFFQARTNWARYATPRRSKLGENAFTMAKQTSSTSCSRAGLIPTSNNSLAVFNPRNKKSGQSVIVDDGM